MDLIDTALISDCSEPVFIAAPSKMNYGFILEIRMRSLTRSSEDDRYWYSNYIIRFEINQHEHWLLLARSQHRNSPDHSVCAADHDNRGNSTENVIGHSGFPNESDLGPICDPLSRPIESRVIPLYRSSVEQVCP